MARKLAALALSTVLAAASYAPAATVYRFDTDPFEGTDALTTPGRQIVTGELFIPGFSIDEDIFSFDPAVFGVDAEVRFFSGLAADLPAGGPNVIVLQDVPGGLNAGAAATLIAAEITQPGAGFFIYHNAALGVNRLVYSIDLSDETADLKILARLTLPTGQAAIDALPTFTEGNFAIQAVPEPATLALAALGGIGLLRMSAHRRRRTANEPGITQPRP